MTAAMVRRVEAVRSPRGANADETTTTSVVIPVKDDAALLARCLAALHAQGKLPYDRLVKFYDFSDINQAIADSKSGEVIKPILRMGS